MQNLRAALEELDEALDRLEDAVASAPAAPKQPELPLPKFDANRTEIARRLDQVIVDMQELLDRAA